MKRTPLSSFNSRPSSTLHSSSLRRTLLCSVALMLLSGLSLTAKAQTPIPADESCAIVDSIVGAYSDWSRVELNGKLSMDGLPLSPSVRFYMEKGKLIRLSLRVPFMGEVGRLEVDTDSIMVVNKMNKTYTKESMEDAMRNFPTGLGDIQDLLLRRIFLLGSGTLRSRDCDKVELFAQDNAVLVVPEEQPQGAGMNYGFQVDTSLKLTDLVATASAYNLLGTVHYADDGFGTVMTISLSNPNPQLYVTLSLDAPRWGAYPMEPFTPGGKFTRLGMKDFIKKLHN